MLHIVVKNGVVTQVIRLSEHPDKQNTRLEEEFDYKVEYLDDYEGELSLLMLASLAFMKQFLQDIFRQLTGSSFRNGKAEHWLLGKYSNEGIQA